MFRNLFGGKKPAARSDQPVDQPLARGGSVRASTPWDGADDYIAANLAVADLINNLPSVFAVGGRIHAETLMAASGAIAGYAAGQALLAQLSAEGETAQSSGLQTVRTTDGRQWLFGDRLNWMLVPQSDSVSEASEKLWPLALGGAVSAGLDPERLPDLGAMFAHVAGTIGGDKEGTTSLPDCQFQRPTIDLLKAAWPLALKCFNGELSGRAIKPHLIVSQRWRPAIAAITANKMIRDVAGVLPPLAAVTIVMETAIYASKLPPQAITED